MARKQSEIIKSNELDVALLKEIYEHELSLKEIAAKVKEIKDRQKNLIWQVQQKNITRAGNYELVPVVKINRYIDVVVARSLLDDDKFMEAISMSISKAEYHLTKENLELCTHKTPSTTYKVIKHDL
jgi:hypothetical protein